MTAETVSPDEPAKARKTVENQHTYVLQRLEKVSQTVVARKIGVSDSKISRAKEDLGSVMELIVGCGLKVVPSDAVVMTQEEMRVLKRWGIEYLEADLEKDRLAGHL